MTKRLSPGVYVSEGTIGIPRFDGTQVTKTAFVGVCERGPVDEAVECATFEDFRRIFGGLIIASQLPVSVQGYFAEGGTGAKVVRIVHHTDPEDPATKTSAAAECELNTAATSPSPASITTTEAEPFALEAGDELHTSVNGGGNQTATVAATPAVLTSGSTEPFSLANGQTLQFTVNDGPTTEQVEFLASEFPLANPITAALAVDVAAVINHKARGIRAYDDGGAVVIETDRQGTGASLSAVTGSAAAELAFPAGDDGSGNVADVSAVTAAEIEAMVAAAVTSPAIVVEALDDGRVKFSTVGTGPSATIQFPSSDLQVKLGIPLPTAAGSSGAATPTLRVFGRYDGAYANIIEPVVRPASNGDEDRFDLSFLVDGLTVSGEVFQNLSMDSTDSRYVETIINADPLRGGSRLCLVEDLEAAAGTRRPGDGTHGPLEDGDDGLAGLVDADFLGASSSLGTTGLRCLDEHPDVNLLVVPGESSAAMAAGIVDYVEFTRLGRLFAVLSTPQSLTAQGIRTYVKTTAALRGLTTRAAIYWPEIEIRNPNTTVYGTGDTIFVDPSGHIAGVMARTDAAQAGGIYRAPAGTTRGAFRTVVGLASTEEKDEKKRDLLNLDFINVLRTPERGGRIFIDGSHVLNQDTAVNRVSIRRGIIFISEALRVGLADSVHEPNDPELWSAITRGVTQFLVVQMKNGAFASKVQSEAFTVDVSENLNPPESVDEGNVNVQIGVAPSRPAEFINVVIFPDRRALGAIGA